LPVTASFYKSSDGGNNSALLYSKTGGE